MLRFVALSMNQVQPHKNSSYKLLKFNVKTTINQSQLIHHLIFSYINLKQIVITKISINFSYKLSRYQLTVFNLRSSFPISISYRTLTQGKYCWIWTLLFNVTNHKLISGVQKVMCNWTLLKWYRFYIIFSFACLHTTQTEQFTFNI